MLQGIFSARGIPPLPRQWGIALLEGELSGKPCRGDVWGFEGQAEVAQDAPDRGNLHDRGQDLELAAGRVVTPDAPEEWG